MSLLIILWYIILLYDIQVQLEYIIFNLFNKNANDEHDIDYIIYICIILINVWCEYCNHLQLATCDLQVIMSNIYEV